MSLFRAAARTMLASYFVVSGVRALKDPSELVPAAEPLVDRIVPLVKQYAPDQVANRIPDDTATLVRINGALQLVGGLALATGKGRRLGAGLLAASLVPSTLAKHPFWTRSTPEERSADAAHFLKNISLLGGVLLAARDTEGRPSLAYRAHKTQEALSRDGRKTSKKIAKAGHELTDQGRELAEGALAGGSLLVGSVIATGRKAKKQAAKELKRNSVVARKQLVEAKKVASSAAKDAQKAAAQATAKARKEAPKLAKQAQKAARQARKDAPKLAKQAQKAALQARKDAPKLAKQARKDGAKAARKAFKETSKAVRQVRKDGGNFLDHAIKDGSKLAEQVKKDSVKVAGNVVDTAQHQIDAIKHTASDVAKNIQLGDN